MLGAKFGPFLCIIADGIRFQSDVGFAEGLLPPSAIIYKCLNSINTH